MMVARKAVALISGGLDSMLAAKLILDQGIHVEGLNFYTGFCVEGHTHAIRVKDKNKQKRNNALWVAEQLNIPLHIIDIVEDYKQIVINPKYGYGAHLNPCLDCKIFMVGRAKAWMEENGFDFIITGEVIGQRPKSQRRETMPLVAKQSGAGERVVRPLCAHFLPPTLPELEGWIDREKLKAVHGRGRKQQIAMAGEYGYDDYAQPAGGCCFLTNAAYSAKLQDLWNHRGSRDYELDDIMLLKVGRHLRPNQRFKMIIGREEGENLYLQGYRKYFTTITTTSHEGPLALIDGEQNDEDIQLAARITARYSQGRAEERVTLLVQPQQGDSLSLTAKPMLAEEIPDHWFIV